MFSGCVTEIACCRTAARGTSDWGEEALVEVDDVCLELSASLMFGRLDVSTRRE